MDPDIFDRVRAVLSALTGRRAEAAEVRAPSGLKTPIAYRPQPGYVSHGRGTWDQLVNSPLAQDTLASVLAHMLPNQAVQTIRTVRDSDVAGEYFDRGPQKGEVELNLGAPLTPDERRNTLIHELGHAVYVPRLTGPLENTARRHEGTADLFAGMISALSQTGQSSDMDRLATALLGIKNANQERRDNPTGQPIYDDQLPPEVWTEIANSMLQELLGAGIYQNHPLNRR